MCEISMNNQIEFYMTMQKIIERVSPNSANELAKFCENYISIVDRVCAEYIVKNNKDFTVTDYENAFFDNVT